MPRRKVTKRDKFLQLSEPRKEKVIDALRILGNCSNTAIYDYTTNDVKRIFGEINRAVKAAKARFDVE